MNDEDLRNEDEMNENEEMEGKVDTQEESMEAESNGEAITSDAEVEPIPDDGFEVDEVPVVDDESLDVTESVESEKELDKEADQAAVDLSKAQSDDEIPSNWIEVKDGKFLCNECENESVPETNTVDGTVNADTEKIKQELIERPTKIIYGSCPICGMEYLFKQKNNKLFMEPSEMLK